MPRVSDLRVGMDIEPEPGAVTQYELQFHFPPACTASAISPGLTLPMKAVVS